MKRFKMWKFMLILSLSISIISWVLGFLMYRGNERDTFQNLLAVRLTDFIQNVEYGLHFGKSMESYYGMTQLLEELTQNLEDVEALFIVDREGETLFGTDRVPLPEKAAGLQAGENVSQPGKLYCAFELTENARLISRSAAGALEERCRSYLWTSLAGSLAGFLVCGLVLLAVCGSSRGAVAVITLWIVVQSAGVGIACYREYQANFGLLAEAVEYSVLQDITGVEALGLKREEIYGLEEYLERYSQRIAEFESVELTQTGVRCRASAGYLFRIELDYVLRAVLFMMFSVLILTEYQMYLSDAEAGKEQECLCLHRIRKPGIRKKQRRDEVKCESKT